MKSYEHEFYVRDSWLNNEAVKKGDNKVTLLDVKHKRLLKSRERQNVNI